MKKDKKHDTLAVIDNYNFYDIQTDRHGNSMTDPVQRAELIKTVKSDIATKGGGDGCF